MRYIAPMLAGCVLMASGCGPSRPNPSVAAEEVRHPSNDMAPLQKVKPETPKRASAKRPPVKPPHPPPTFEDPRKIPPGINYSEMVRRFGPPSMKVVDGPARTTFSYSKLKTQVQVEVQNGKVVSVAAINTGF